MMRGAAQPRDSEPSSFGETSTFHVRLADVWKLLRLAHSLTAEMVLQNEARLQSLSEDKLTEYVALRRQMLAVEAFWRILRLLLPAKERHLVKVVFDLRERLDAQATSLAESAGRGNTLGLAEQEFRAALLGIEDFAVKCAIPREQARKLIARVCSNHGQKDVTSDLFGGAWRRWFQKLPSEREAMKLCQFSPRAERKRCCTALLRLHKASPSSGSRPDDVIAEMVKRICLVR